MELSPKYAGTLMGITNTAANMAGFAAPQLTGVVIHENVRYTFVFCWLSLMWSSYFSLFLAHHWRLENSLSHRCLHLCHWQCDFCSIRKFQGYEMEREKWRKWQWVSFRSLEDFIMWICILFHLYMISNVVESCTFLRLSMSRVGI